MSLTSKKFGNVICPECKFKQSVEIPAQRCQALYRCEHCRKIIRAVKTCCVFCEYGDVKCNAVHVKKLFRV